MDERGTIIKKNNKPKWKIKIKELKKDIEVFQTEVENLLRDVSSNIPLDNICVLCNKNNGCRDLPCQHIICLLCHQHHMKNNSMITCPVCQYTHYQGGMVHGFDSFSSSSDEMV